MPRMQTRFSPLFARLRVTARLRCLKSCAAAREWVTIRLVYVGDGSSDVHVMLHVNRLDGLTIAVSENKQLNEIAKRTVLSDDALCVLVPILEEIAGYDPVRIRTVFESQGFVLQEWEKTRTDSLTIAANA